MNPKEFLQQAYVAHHNVDVKLEELSRLKEKAARTTTVLKCVPIGGQKDISRIENAIAEIDDKTREFADEIEKLVGVVDAVHSAIAQVKDSNAQLVLKYKYLCFFSWQQISILMRKSLRQLYRIHNEALEKYFR